MKLGSINPIIGLDVPSSTSPINTEMVEIPPIFNPNLQEKACLKYDQESKMKFKKWNKLIVDKKFVITIIFNQWNEDTRAEIALEFSYEDNFEAGELIKFLAIIHTVYNNTDNEEIFFGSWITKITKHDFQPTPIVEELLSAHLTEEAILDNTNPCNISFDIIDGAEIAASIKVTKESTTTTTIFMSIEDDEPWFDAHDQFYSWYNTPEIMDNYKEWDNPPNILGNTSITSESLNKHIKPDFYISKRQT